MTILYLNCVLFVFWNCLFQNISLKFSFCSKFVYTCWIMLFIVQKLNKFFAWMKYQYCQVIYQGNTLIIKMKKNLERFSIWWPCPIVVLVLNAVSWLWKLCWKLKGLVKRLTILEWNESHPKMLYSTSWEQISGTVNIQKFYLIQTRKSLNI